MASNHDIWVEALNYCSKCGAIPILKQSKVTGRWRIICPDNHKHSTEYSKDKLNLMLDWNKKNSSKYKH